MKKEWTLYNEIELVEPKFGKMPDGAKEKWIEDLPQEEYDRIYISYLRKVGLGSCYFRNTEHNAQGIDYEKEGITDIYGMSKYLWDLQKRLRAEGGWVCKSQDQFENYTEPYLGADWCVWLRPDDTLRFANIYSGMAFFRDEAWNWFYDWIMELIPHDVTHETIPDLMRPGLVKLVQNVDAGGKEKELEIIEKLHVEFCKNEEGPMIEAFLKASGMNGKFFVVPNKVLEHEPDNLIFMDLDACKKVSLDQIESDVNQLASPVEEVEKVSQELKAKLLEVWQGFTDGVL